jgi:methyl-accepting chemotaxis protein
MNKLKMRTKIIFGFGLVIIIMAVLMGVISLVTKNVEEELKTLNQIEIPLVQLADAYNINTLDLLIYQAKFLIDSRDEKSIKAALAAFGPMTKEMLAQGKALQASAQGEAAEALNQMMTGLEEKLRHWESSLKQMEQGVYEREKVLDSLDSTSAEFMQACLNYESRHGQLVEAEINKFNSFSGGDISELRRRIGQSALLTAVISKFSSIQTKIFSATHDSDVTRLRELIKEFDPLDDTIKQLSAMTATAANLEYLKSLLNYSAACRQLLAQGAKAIEDTAARRQQCLDVSAALRAMFDEANRKSLAMMYDSAQRTGSYIEFTRIVIVAGFIVSLILSILIALGITGMVVRPVKATSAALEAIANGDFTVNIDPAMLRRKDEMGIMLADAQRMCETLSATFASMIEDAEVVANAATEISQGNQSLSAKTQQQAGAIQETASALEQMTSSVKNNAQSSEAANRMARETSRIAQDGGKAVERTVEAMREVTASSKKINDIINVVNEIAFQTNLLALNAAVEAARAGEAGRGFAVVAGEVRNLAGRSAQAAKEIQTLITDSVSKVEHGNNLVAESGELLSKIITNIREVSDTIHEISSASQEQATGIEQVSKAVSQMDEAVQQNAAFVEEVASSSDSMTSVAKNMRSQISRFKVRKLKTPSLPAPAGYTEEFKPAAPPRPAAPARPTPRLAAPRPVSPAKPATAPAKPAPKPLAVPPKTQPKPTAAPAPARPAPKPAGSSKPEETAPAAYKSGAKDDFFGVSELDGFEEF